MKNTIITKLFIAIAAFCMAGCSSDNTEHIFRQVEIKSSNVLFESSGGTGTIELLTEGVSASTNQSWCVASVNGLVVTVTAEPNPSIQDRNALLELSVGSMKRYVPISQYGSRLKVLKLSELNGFGERGYFEYECGGQEIEVKSTDAADWLQLTIEADNILFVALPNLDQDNKRTAHVVFKPKGANDLEFPIEFEQGTGPASFMTLVDQRTLASEGETVRFKYESFFKPVVKDVSVDWLQVEVDDDSIVLTVDPNADILNGRGTVITFVDESDPTIEMTVEVEQRRAMTYELFLGKYTLHFALDRDKPVEQAIAVELIRSELSNTYLIKGILSDETMGEVKLQYDEDLGLLFVPHKVGVDPSVTRDIWINLGYGNRGANTNENSAAMVADRFETEGGLGFTFVHRSAPKETDTCAGIFFRTYPTGSTSSSNDFKDKTVGSSSGKYYYMKFKKLP